MEFAPWNAYDWWADYYPTTDEAIERLKSYESKYNLPINRAEDVVAVVPVKRTEIIIVPALSQDLLELIIECFFYRTTARHFLSHVGVADLFTHT